MSDLAARLLAKVEELAEAASPGPWRFDYISGRPWRVQGPVAEEIATFAWRKNDGDKANAHLAAAFGSPDRALAIVEALVADGHTGAPGPVKSQELWHPEGCLGCALVRDLAAALGVEEQSDGS